MGSREARKERIDKYETLVHRQLFMAASLCCVSYL